MKVRGLKSVVKQVTFEGDHPSTGIISSESWYRLRNLIAKHYNVQPDTILSLKITPSGLEIYWSELHPLK